MKLNTTLFMPVKLNFSEGSVPDAAQELKRLGRRCLIVCSKTAAKTCGALDDALEALRKQEISFELFDEIEPNPSVQTCIRAGNKAHDTAAEFILGIGGGSAMDAAKAISVFAANSELDEMLFYQKYWPKAPLPIALIGTTAGTGSEVTMVSVLTDSSGRKHSIHDERLYAKMAFSDPRYLRTMPDRVLFSTGIDALCHCAESYFSKKATVFSASYALEGTAIAIDPLRKLLAGDRTDEIFVQLYYASIFGGLAINLTGTCFPHNLGYYLTERFGISHGFASAAFLNDLIRFETETNPERARILIGKTGLGISELARLIERIVDVKNITINRTELKAILPRWQDNASVRNTLGDIGIEQIEQILMKFV